MNNDLLLWPVEPLPDSVRKELLRSEQLRMGQVGRKFRHARRSVGGRLFPERFVFQLVEVGQPYGAGAGGRWFVFVRWPSLARHCKVSALRFTRRSKAQAFVNGARAQGGVTKGVVRYRRNTAWWHL